MNKLLITLWILSLATPITLAQETDSLIFDKGRVLTSLYGNISNQYVDVNSGGSVKTTGYRIGTQSGVFLKKNWALGLNFSLSKSNFDKANMQLDNEELLLGLWSRFYFAENGAAALYAELTPHYTSVYNQNNFRNSDGELIFDEEVFGKGFGIIPGIGFTYIISKNVGFGMSLSYTASKVFLDKTESILQSDQSDTFTISELQFNFSFQVYLDQFFF